MPSLGYEPYDICLRRPKLSLAGVVISANKTDPVSLCQLGLVLSRSVRFTIGLQKRLLIWCSPTPCRPSAAAILGAPHGVRVRQATSPPVMPDAEPPRLTAITTAGPAQGTGRTVVLPRPFPRTRLLRDLAAGGVLFRVGPADHAVTLKTPWTGSGWREYSYGEFGRGHPPFHPHAF